MKDLISNRVPLRQLRLCRRQEGFLSLPDELLLLILKGLPCKDLIKMRQVHPRFKELVDTSSTLWKMATFIGEWPSGNNFKLFERAADEGNIEALIKLGVAYLYYEGPVTDSGRKDTEYNGRVAAKYFCKAEQYSKLASTFMWLFIRPPWNTNGACCKACVLTSMQDLCDDNKNNNHPSVLMCIAKTHSLSEEDEVETITRPWLEKACHAGSSDAAYALWKTSQSSLDSLESVSLQSIRSLREIASGRSIDAKLELYSTYCKGFYGGLPSQQVASTLRQFFQSSIPSNNHNIYKLQKGLNSEMRHILVDWLIEVTGMKDYSSLTLHTTICSIDRYLMMRPITRADLQLVGIAGMVVCARLLEKDIITIREAAWLTDGTYQYEDVVRMLGDIVATLHGNLRVLTAVDYLNLLCQMVSADKKTKDMAMYICETSLLYSAFGSVSPAKIASCAIYLTRLLFNAESPWTMTMLQSTGFDIKDLEKTTLNLHRNCFSGSPLTDHREVKLVAVKERYAVTELSEVSKFQSIPYAVLCDMLGAESQSSPNTKEHQKSPAMESFLMSPSSKAKPADINDDKETDFYPRAVTPTSVPGIEKIAENPNNQSFCSINSGYEGDEESDGELVHEDFLMVQENKEALSDIISNEKIDTNINVTNNLKNLQLPSRDTENSGGMSYNSVHSNNERTVHPNMRICETNSGYLSPCGTKQKGHSFTIGGGGKLGLRRSRPALVSVHKRVYHLRNRTHHVEPKRESLSPNHKHIQNLRM
ncbi:cyclin-F-like [Antedon mediterranea]|uniref:cyclin-F-like n=1 Tax=Antedon mediterranea TaxID=105859 RepID=UPI003AF78522